jgi:hypothetical protein
VPPVGLRPRSTTELMDAAAGLMRLHYLELVTVNALFTIPGLIITVIYAPDVTVESGQDFGALMGRVFVGTVIVIAVALVSSALANATTVIIVSDNYLGREVTIGNAITQAFSRFGTVLLVALLQALAVGVGLVLFVIPGFLCVAWFFAAVTVVVVEGRGPIESLRRSRDLARGSVNHILGVYFLTGLVVGVASALINALLAALASATHLGPQAAAVLSNAATVLVSPFFAVVTTLLYFDLRIRKEGLDLELMAKELGVGGLAPA